MKKVLLFLLLLVGQSLYSQIELRNNPFIKGLIVLKDNDSLKGYIQLNGSAFDIRFKDSLKQRKRKKVKYKKVRSITIFSDINHTRKFYYKKTDQSKFLHFAELVHFDELSVYITSSNKLELFYLNSKVDRRSANEMMRDMKTEQFKITEKLIENSKNFKSHSEFKNGLFSHLTFNNNFAYHFKIERIDYFLNKKTEDKLTLIGSKGNFLYKNFKKTASKYFGDCPTLVNKIQSKEFKLKHLPEILEFYKNNCNKE
ncbi:hypothetical protein OD91_0497 [Lutibacter sp. Hel_I_33_5]|uniref:hypothetical protein n=1 Tax=Lutibacter sp. Hel_I_33_5 TaxID=1566289 RepID=UPI0011A3F6A6|nr:hypothetical protein [Lutibacter sp. Hel_I_33_5]TVZ55251.1 hypothetical protein OD91_0497 [Lutibacter sp. Hel_I_33_5]